MMMHNGSCIILHPVLLRVRRRRDEKGQRTELHICLERVDAGIGRWHAAQCPMLTCDEGRIVG